MSVASAIKKAAAAVLPFRGNAKNVPAKDAFMLPYQAKWIADPALFKLMQKSRRVGITYATSYDLVREHSLETSRVDTWASSRDDLTAQEFIRYAKAFAGVLDKGARDMGVQVLDENGSTGSVLRFSAGTRINSVASNPDVFVGKGGNVLLDEFAVRRDPRGVFAIASPVIAWGGRMCVVSTHRGTANYFNELVREVKEKGNPKGISLHTVTLQDALDQGFLWKLQTKLPAADPRMAMDEADYFNWIRASCADEETFLQEYCCVPGDDAGAFLSYDLITGCEYSEQEEWRWMRLLEEERAAAKLYLGVDVGRDHDLTVIYVLQKLGGIFFERARVEMKALSFDAQEAMLYGWLALPQVQRCCIDSTGIGRQFAERAKNRFGWKVEAVHFTGAVKEELAYPVRAAFEDKSVRIEQDPHVRADLRAVKKETTAAGNIRFTADRGKNGHSDRFWALALALHAGKGAGGWRGPAVLIGGSEHPALAGDHWQSVF